MKSDLEHAMEYHGEAFPGFAKWLKDNPGQMKFIAKTIGHLSRDQLKEATDALYAAEKKPYGYSQHASALLSCISYEALGGVSGAHSGPTLADGVLVFSCRKCQDYGWVNVLTPATLKRIRTGDVSPIWTCTLVCDCRAGRGKKGTRWSDGYCLIEYTQLLDAAIARKHDYGTTDEAMWAIATDQVRARDEELRPHAEALDGAELP